MTRVFPLRFRRRSDGLILFGNEVGQHFLSDQNFLNRLSQSALNTRDISFLMERAMAFETEGDLNHTAYLSRLAKICEPPKRLDYLILVPTLRCDLSCSYCQVSRASIDARGYDWDEATLQSVLSFINQNGGDEIQIEFQGGEPTLRCDLIERVMTFCRNRFSHTSFVICTNLSSLTDELVEIAKHEDVFISTSLDGSTALHRQQRTISATQTDQFFSNLEAIIAIAPGRVSALPTIDPNRLPNVRELIDLYVSYGIYSIFLRPIFFHGFARKRYPDSSELDQNWAAFYDEFVDELIQVNASQSNYVVEEYYLSLALAKLTRQQDNSHIDWRSPNWLGYDHLLIDYDGQLYPSDEARMLARSRLIDLSIGDVTSGLDVQARTELQGSAFNALDPWCSECVYQGVCGSDPIDDIARYGRVDVPRPMTAYCQKNMHVFDKATELLYSDDFATKQSVRHWLNLPSGYHVGATHL
jgi:His-Xaa-Ser system radical SAM maturase HxsB